mgnify:CR=1 FL=1
MQLDLLNEYLTKFKVERSEDKWISFYEAVDNFQTNWDLQADDLVQMYNTSLHSMHSRRWWNREAFEPKRVMLAFMKLEPDFCKHAFRDLFDETKTIDGRVERFVFYCGELLDLLKESSPKSKIRSHYHDKEYQMPFLYLALKYPHQYAPYDFEGFCQFLGKVGSRQIPPTHDLERYPKVIKTLSNMLNKEEISSPYPGMLVYEFISFVTGRDFPL